MRKFIGLILAVILVCTFVSAPADEYTVPELDETYPGQTVRLAGKTNEQRVFAYYGPGADYYSAHGYKPYKQRTITAYFNEGGWVLIHLRYQSAKERYLYMPDTAFTSLDGVSRVCEMSYYEAVTTDATPLRLGPADDFISENELRSIPAETELKVFFRKNGYYFAEFMNKETPVRMWMPDSTVTITGEGVYTPAERERIPVRNISTMSIGEWSSWDDFDVAAGDGIEVEERKLYRVKHEIMEWSDWTDTIPPQEYFEMYPEYIQEKEAVDEDGWTVTMWRTYGFNDHYSEWSEWTDDETQFKNSSGDIVEEKTQRRYRRIK